MGLGTNSDVLVDVPRVAHDSLLLCKTLRKLREKFNMSFNVVRSTWSETSSCVGENELVLVPVYDLCGRLKTTHFSLKMEEHSSSNKAENLQNGKVGVKSLCGSFQISGDSHKEQLSVENARAEQEGSAGCTEKLSRSQFYCGMRHLPPCY